MIRIRSQDELCNVLARDIARRKHEMTVLKLGMSNARSHEKLFLIRAGFVMIYAHFEGFIRTASSAYISYVAYQGLSFNLLKANFVAVGIKSQLQDLGEIGKATVVSATVHRFLEGMDDKAQFSWFGEIDCRNNLNRDVLREIFALTGLDSAWYETKWAFVDEILLEHRNNIAHGRDIRPEESLYEQAHNQTIEFIEHFRTDVENAAAMKLYRRQP
jgi:hypothetical protein